MQDKMNQMIDVDVGQGKQSLPVSAVVGGTVKWIESGQYSRARSILTQLTDLFPQDIDIRTLQLHLAVAQRNFAEAEALADELAPLSIDNSHRLALCIRAYRQAGKNTTALRFAVEGTVRFPECPACCNELGLCHMQSGDKESALTAFNRAIELAPEFIQPYMGRARVAPGQLEPGQLDAMLTLPQKYSLSPEDSSILNFAIAWAYEGVDADRHFEYLHRGNSAIAKSRPWRESAQQMRLSRTLGFFSAELRDSCQPFSVADLSPIFVIGLPRSGTSLTEQILASHSDVTGCGETRGIESAMNAVAAENQMDLEKMDWPDSKEFGTCFASIDRYYRAGLQLFDIDTPFFTDKSLSSDWWVGLVLMLYSRAKVVHILRDPMDSALSMYQLHFSVGQEFTYDLEAIAKTYQHHIRLMHHWQELFPGRIHSITYEELVDKQKSSTAKMLEFCGLEWQDDCMNFHMQSRPVRTASELQVKQPLYRSAVGRSKAYLKHLDPVARIIRAKT
jgi:Tfp pilus assembly protein PilF